MNRDQIFALKFKGVQLQDNEIFKVLQGFTPTGRAKTLPITPVNLHKFKTFLATAHNYYKTGSQYGLNYDFSKRTNLEHLELDNDDKDSSDF